MSGNASDQFLSGGIVVVSGKQFGGSLPRDNQIVNNVAYNNRPADIRYDRSGSGNVFTNNHCRQSIPVGFCR